MEAPAPASALIHSATLVSAGIFLVLRFGPIMDASYLAKNIIPIMGSMTAMYGGVVAAAQTDVKRILAYSTISHCGFMMLLSAAASVDLTLLYLYVHGFFKALLFLSAGSLMRFFKSQDYRYMGGAYRYLPLETVICIVGFAHLSGAPFSFGYVTKHYVLTTLSGDSWLYLFYTLNVYISVFASVIYSVRFVYGTGFDAMKAKKPIYEISVSRDFLSKHSSNSTFAGSLIILINYIFAVSTCLYVQSLWVSDSLLSPTTNSVINNSLIAASSELSTSGAYYQGYMNLLVPVVVFFFGAYVLLSSRTSMYPEQTLGVAHFLLTLTTMLSLCFSFSVAFAGLIYTPLCLFIDLINPVSVIITDRFDESVNNFINYLNRPAEKTFI